MFRKLLIRLSVSIVLAAVPTSALAQVGTAITYQGQLTDAGNVVNSPTDMRFSLWSAASGGAQVGSTVENLAVSVSEGLFTCTLDFGASPYTSDQGLWLQVDVRNPPGSGSYVPMGSRQKFAAAPFSLATRGINVDGAGNAGLSGNLRVTGDISARPLNATHGHVTLSSGDATNPGLISWWRPGPSPLRVGYMGFGNGGLSNLSLHLENGAAFTINDGSVGIGTTTPSARLDVRTPASGIQFIAGRADSDSSTYISDRTIGFEYGTNASAEGIINFYGYQGGLTQFRDLRIADGKGNPIALFKGSTASVGMGTTAPASTTRLEVERPNTGNFIHKAVSGKSTGGTTGQNIGVYGEASTGGTGVAYAGLFQGNTHVNGVLSKSSGAFKIDHPLDPANKYLWHSFVESPDMMNIYNGNVVTDGTGYATVKLPDWFEALNRDFRYQLTPIGSFSRAMVAEEVRENTFVIRTEQPNVKVSWQVTGIRQDAFAEANRIPVEQVKPDSEKGSYLVPELFGHTEERRFDRWLDAQRDAAAPAADGND
ncbi:MAG: hypothetical protein ACKVS9_19240 [Phycisphaerae bacterium]